MTEKTVAEIDATGLCTACGTCVAVCPTEAIQMQETGAGSLAPLIDPGLCTGCGICREVCPGLRLLPGLMPADCDPFIGPVKGAFTAQAKDAELLLGAQSGGVATLVLLHLLKSGTIDKAVVTKMPRDGSLRPYVIATSDETEILEARGSQYSPVAVNAALSGLDPGERVALVGCACHIHGLRNAQAKGLLRQVEFTIGLFCERTLSRALLLYLVERAGVDPAGAKHFRYRDKRWRGWTGDVLVEDAEGDIHWLDRRCRMKAKDAFTLPHCRLCFDKLNVLSDLSVGDAHGLSDDKRGVSAVLARTQRGLDALRRLERSGSLRLEEVGLEKITEASAPINERRHSWQQYTRTWRDMGRAAPDFGIPESPPASCGPMEDVWRERLTWSLRLHSCRHLGQAVALGRWYLSVNKWLRRLRPYRLRSPLRRLLYRCGARYHRVAMSELRVSRYPDG